MIDYTLAKLSTIDHQTGVTNDNETTVLIMTTGKFCCVPLCYKVGMGEWPLVLSPKTL